MTEFSIIIVFAFAMFSILGISSIGGVFTERVGIVNIGIDGMMVVGAAFYGFFALMFSSEANLGSAFQIPLMMISAFATMVFSWLHGYITIKLKGDQIISGVAINLLAVGISWVFLIVFAPKFAANENRYFAVNILELALDSSPLSGGWGNLISLKMFLLIAIAIGSWYALTKTKWGLRLKSIGENPQAADVAGINVNRYKWQGVSISGLLAGIAGAIAIQVLFNVQQFRSNVNGLGFLALAIVIMGQWRIEWVMLSAFIFSILYSLGVNITTDSSATKNLMQIIPYVATVLLLIFVGKNSLAPKALGVPYEKSKR